MNAFHAGSTFAQTVQCGLQRGTCLRQKQRDVFWRFTHQSPVTNSRLDDCSSCDDCMSSPSAPLVAPLAATSFATPRAGANSTSTEAPCRASSAAPSRSSSSVIMTNHGRAPLSQAKPTRSALTGRRRAGQDNLIPYRQSPDQLSITTISAASPSPPDRPLRP